MDCRELRIGNLIQYKENTVTVIGTSISANSTVEIKLETENEGQKFTMQIPILIELGHLSPIPLTEEWLVRLGFEKIVTNGIEFVKYSKYKDFEIEVSLYVMDNKLVTGDDFEIQYVHQLQNLYFALTGEELSYSM